MIPEPSSLVRVTVAEFPVEHGHDKHHEKQQPGDRRSVAETPRAESLRVNVVRQRRGRPGRTAVGHHARHIESALKPADHRHDHDEERHVRQLRPGDVPESLPRGRPVDVSGLIELLRDTGESREIEQHVVRADRTPEPHDQQCRLRPVVIRGPVRRREPLLRGGHFRQNPEDAAEPDQRHVQHHRRTVDNRGVPDAAVDDAGVFAPDKEEIVQKSPPADPEENQHEQQHPVRIAAQQRKRLLLARDVQPGR